MPQQPYETPHPSLYSVHPGLCMVQSIIANMKQKTGRTLEEWIELVLEEGPSTEKERREWLKGNYKLGTNYAWWIAERAEGKGLEDSDPDAYLQAAEKWVEAMFSGPKAGLLPVYERLLRLGKALGEDVKISPGKTIVPFYRQHVFAQIKPATNTRIDLGFALKDREPAGRLLSTGGFAKGDRITHRIPITSLEEIDEEVNRWLKTAYDLDG